MRGFLLGGVLAILTVCSPSPSQAATLTIIGQELIGATGVNVNGTLYDVQFVDGSCFVLFSGCRGDPSGFVFQTQSGALAASESLLEQVFLDVSPGLLFDSNPFQTWGCDVGPVWCYVITPYALRATNPLIVESAYAFNHVSEASDTFAAGAEFVSSNYGTDPSRVYARWTVHSVEAPEPTFLLLLSTGLLGAGVRRCWRKGRR